MAFTEAQKATIRKYLGWPLYKTYNTKLESVMDLIGETAAHQTLVEAKLADIAAIETEIAQLHGVAIAESVEGSKLNPRRYEDLRAAGRREVRALASMFHTDVERDIFGAGWAGGPMRMG